MPIIVQCSCGKKLSAKDELRGKKVKCPGCQQLLTVPPGQPESDAITEKLEKTVTNDSNKRTDTAAEPQSNSYAFQDDDPPKRKKETNRAERTENTVTNDLSKRTDTTVEPESNSYAFQDSDSPKQKKESSRAERIVTAVRKKKRRKLTV
jgi:hypothetical protein